MQFKHLRRDGGSFIGPKIKRNQTRKRKRTKGRKSNRKKSQNGEEGRKLFNESCEEKLPEENPILNRQVCIHSISPLAGRRIRKNLTQGNVLTSLLEMKEFVTGLPIRLNRLMDGITHSEFEIKVRSMDAKTVVEGFQKVANRITAGIILGSLILGAALLIRIQTSFQLLGYPGIAILCFLGAAAGGLCLLFSIFFQDERIKKKRKT